MDLKIHILIQLKYLQSLRCLEEEQVLIAVREAVFLLNDRVLFHHIIIATNRSVDLLVFRHTIVLSSMVHLLNRRVLAHQVIAATTQSI